MKKLFFTFIAILSIIAVNAQCSMCVATIESNQESMVGRGLNSGILFLMAMPYILMSIVGFIWYRNYKNKQAQLN